MLDRSERADWRRIAVSSAPGISALQSAAARIGAPLGHDFCAISLSDLMTPWAMIERRVRAAAEGDFVIAFYNPVSKRRTTQLGEARDILLSHRPAETPVVLARNLGRPGESVEVLALKDLSADRVDMLTLVLVGSSETRRVHRGDGGIWVYTPRGYRARETVPQK
jgi:cobalt-precorrin 5A hydrolase/precorrin-3B C17-methyltransferase